MVSVWHVDSSAFSALITLLNSTCQISGPTLPYDCREQSRHQWDLPPFLTVSLRSVFRAVPCIVAKHQLRKILWAPFADRAAKNLLLEALTTLDEITSGIELKASPLKESITHPHTLGLRDPGCI